MKSAPELAAAVRERARDRCQYCLMHQHLQGATFHVEHIIPLSRGGSDELVNLTLACPSCNLHKAAKPSQAATESSSSSFSSSSTISPFDYEEEDDDEDEKFRRSLRTISTIVEQSGPHRGA